MFCEPGYLDLPSCGPWRGSIDDMVRPIYITFKIRPSQGAKPREVSDIKTSRGSGLPGLPPKEQRFLCRCPPREAKMKQAMTAKAR